MSHYAACGVCDQSGEWPTAEQRETWLDYHWEATGHDRAFRLDRQEEHVHIPGLMQARRKSTCGTCKTTLTPPDLIAPHAGGWQCVECATDRLKETT